VENVTVFEETAANGDPEPENGMHLDTKEEEPGPEKAAPAVASSEGMQDTIQSLTKTVKFDSEESKLQSTESLPDMDTLYSMFWSLQDYFSQPTKLFDDTKLKAFKDGLQATMVKFKDLHQELQARGPAKLVDENKRGVKRKRNGQEENISNSFNPRYLTSRDLFKLEVHRRYLNISILAC